jgi:hypothetical protein
LDVGGGTKQHVRSVLATLAGRPKSSKDRTLRVQAAETPAGAVLDDTADADDADPDELDDAQ